MICTTAGYRGLLGVALALGLMLAAPTVTPAQQTERAKQLIGKLLELAEEKNPLEAKAGDDELVVLLKKRYNVALEELKLRCEEYKSALGPTEPLFEAARHFLNAELDLATSPAEKVKILERALEVMTWYETKLETALKEGLGTRAALLRARYARLNVEIDLLKARRAGGTSTPK